MSFIDEISVHIKAGRGGNGVVRWLHEKFKEFGGPSGGDGGRGGSVYIRGVKDSLLLSKYKHTKEFKAEDGEYGGKNSRHGANGEDLYIDLPVGSIVKNLSTEDIYRLDEAGQEILILKGGNGGYGNEHFKGPTNQQPEEWTPGKHGEEADFYIEVELIADIGLIGLPNAGKSSLLNAVTKADVKVGAYQFTTLEPNLGSLYGVILADIPGLIEGASDGKGLGHKFLRHIRRTKKLIHCISLEGFAGAGVLSDTSTGGLARGAYDTGVDEIRTNYLTIRKELESYDPELAQKEEMILLTKTDTVDPSHLGQILKDIHASMPEWKDKEVKSISIYDADALKEFSEYLTK
jgi:GTPase